jgi:hypothetical protein
MEETEKGYGWVIFAGILLMMAGVYNLIWGIAAVASSTVFVLNTKVVFGTVKGWGWVYLIYGIIQILVGVGIFSRAQWARWLGVIIAALSSFLAFLYIWAYPGWAILLIAVDIMIIYGLAMYGGRPEQT